MSLTEEYLARAQQIIGERSPSEIKYDDEVIKGLKRGKSIRKAIKGAGKKYPDEALKLDESNVEDVTAHYEYLREHQEILRKLQAIQKVSRNG